MSSFATPIKPFPTKRPGPLTFQSNLVQDQPKQGQFNNGINNNNNNQDETTLPEISSIENRLINKELETKRILVNFILFFVLRLVNKIVTVVFQKTESLHQFALEYNQLISIIYKLLQVLFFWNIGNGLYKVFKPQDDFKDLNLTNEQRKLLGLPLLALTKLDSTTSTTSTISLSPIKTTTTTIIPPSLQQKEPSIKLQPPTTPTKHTTPIASPMSSPSPLKKSLSPKKSTLALKPSIQNLKRFDNISTPTYIPSPKYYYRMDSPSRTRRI